MACAVADRVAGGGGAEERGASLRLGRRGARARSDWAAVEERGLRVGKRGPIGATAAQSRAHRRRALRSSAAAAAAGVVAIVEIESARVVRWLAGAEGSGAGGGETGGWRPERLGRRDAIHERQRQRHWGVLEGQRVQSLRHRPAQLRARPGATETVLQLLSDRRQLLVSARRLLLPRDPTPISH